MSAKGFIERIRLGICSASFSRASIYKYGKRQSPCAHEFLICSTLVAILQGFRVSVLRKTYPFWEAE